MPPSADQGNLKGPAVLRNLSKKTRAYQALQKPKKNHLPAETVIRRSKQENSRAVLGPRSGSSPAIEVPPQAKFEMLVEFARKAQYDPLKIQHLNKALAFAQTNGMTAFHKNQVKLEIAKLLEEKTIEYCLQIVQSIESNHPSDHETNVQENAIQLLVESLKQEKTNEEVLAFLSSISKDLNRSAHKALKGELEAIEKKIEQSQSASNGPALNTGKNSN